MAAGEIVGEAEPASVEEAEPVSAVEPEAAPAQNENDTVSAAAEIAAEEVPLPAANTPPPVRDQSSPYDFRQPSLLTAGELRKWRLRHDEFVRSLVTRLSIYLRLEFGVQILDLQTLAYRRFIETLSNPTHVTLFKIEPMDGICLLEMSPRLGLTFVDRLLGGAGNAVSLQRDLTEIEVALLDQAVQIILKEWCQHVTLLTDAVPSLVGHETNGRFLQTSAHDTPMLILTLEVRVNDCTEKMHLAFPFPMLEPLIRQLAPVLDPKKVDLKTTTAPPSIKWNPGLNDVLVPLSAEWQDLAITVRQLSQLKVGDVLPVAPHFAQHVQVRLARITKFVGRLGTRGDAWAVELTQPVKS